MQRGTTAMVLPISLLSASSYATRGARQGLVSF